jgi:hypothetical protein
LGRGREGGGFLKENKEKEKEPRVGREAKKRRATRTRLTSKEVIFFFESGMYAGMHWKRISNSWGSKQQ